MAAALAGGNRGSAGTGDTDGDVVLAIRSEAAACVWLLMSGCPCSDLLLLAVLHLQDNFPWTRWQRLRWCARAHATVPEPEFLPIADR